MNNSNFVNVLDARDNLLSKLDSFTFLYSFIFDDIIEEFTTFRIFHNQVNVGFCFDYLPEGIVTS